MGVNGWTLTNPPGSHEIHNLCGEKRRIDGHAYLRDIHQAVCKGLVATTTPELVEKEKTMAVEKVMAKAPKTLMVEVKDAQGAIVGTLLASERTFTTGSKGFGAYGKIGVKGSSQGYYQVGVNIVLVGSKPSK